MIVSSCICNYITICLLLISNGTLFFAFYSTVIMIFVPQKFPNHANSTENPTGETSLNQTNLANIIFKK